jgi:hypothetical protein
MSYAVRFRRRAKEELDRCCDIYGEELQHDLYKWLEYLGLTAERQEPSDSVDLLELLEEGLEEVETSQHVWERFRDASFLEKIRAFVFFVRHQQPPWQLRSSVRHFTFLGQCSCEVMVIYEIDHLHRRVIITRFDGLPGQP